MLNLDAIDKKIIRCLRRDGRMTNALLAQEVGLSASACLRRVQILEASGVIAGYIALIGSNAEDEDFVALIQITLDKQTEDYLRRFEKAIQGFCEIKECYLISGGADYWLRVVVKNAAAYEAFHKEVLSCLPGVARIQSSFSIRQIMR
ncbi:Lrp/AsnC family transcriptional regulator [Bartonella sp. DGB2]|uniref:Lrp/AsnC family transcriptional regulator n=1 Tax=Bartonella sp. DGB2 TaxID=3388426 RepID=UPI00398FAD3E